MNPVSLPLDARELAADKAAVAQINFCALWPTAKPILTQLASVVSSTMVKLAINTVIVAGDAYCGSSTSRLSKLGLTVPPNAPPGTEAFLNGLSNAELETLASIQRQARSIPNSENDVGTYVF